MIHLPKQDGSTRRKILMPVVRTYGLLTLIVSLSAVGCHPAQCVRSRLAVAPSMLRSEGSIQTVSQSYVRHTATPHTMAAPVALPKEERVEAPLEKPKQTKQEAAVGKKDITQDGVKAFLDHLTECIQRYENQLKSISTQSTGKFQARQRSPLVTRLISCYVNWIETHGRYGDGRKSPQQKAYVDRVRGLMAMPVMQRNATFRLYQARLYLATGGQKMQEMSAILKPVLVPPGDMKHKKSPKKWLPQQIAGYLLMGNFFRSQGDFEQADRWYETAQHILDRELKKICTIEYCDYAHARIWHERVYNKYLQQKDDHQGSTQKSAKRAVTTQDKVLCDALSLDDLFKQGDFLYGLCQGQDRGLGVKLHHQEMKALQQELEKRSQDAA